MVTITLPRSDVVAMCKAFGCDERPKRPHPDGAAAALVNAAGGAVTPAGLAEEEEEAEGGGMAVAVVWQPPHLSVPRGPSLT